MRVFVPQEGLKTRLARLQQTRDAAAEGLEAAQAAVKEERRAAAAAAAAAEEERAALRAECDALMAAAAELRAEVRAAADARDEAAVKAKAEVRCDSSVAVLLVARVKHTRALSLSVCEHTADVCRHSFLQLPVDVARLGL